ncbi:MAG TPA: hypothetical protein VFS43_39710 [Polyangiaceae bacterium]|nr:hypothetical protein [Polyangiaceae bacterium]
MAEAPLSGAVAIEALTFASGVVLPAPPPSFGRKRQPVYREPAPRGDEGSRGEAPAPPAPASPGASPRQPADDGVWLEHPGSDPIVWLWGEVSATKTLSEKWYRRWADPAKPDSLERAWRASEYGEIMVVLLYETDHPAFERASCAAWPLRKYQRRGRAGFRAGGDGFADAVRAIAGEPPSLSAAIAALRSPKPMCPIDELLLHLRYDAGSALAAWAARWGAGGHEPMLAAWRVARSARSMDQLLEHAGKPGAIGPIREAVRRELGGTLDGHPEHHCAAAIRRVVPAPPSLRRVLARRDEIVSSLAGGDP